MSDHDAATQPSALASHIEGDEPATLVNNSAWGFMSQTLGLVAGGVVSVIAIRTFSDVTWGQYAVATSLVSIFTVFSELGLSSLALREMSTDPARAAVILGTGMSAVARTALASAIGAVAVALALRYDSPILVLVAVGLPTLFLQPLLAMIRAAFNARRRLSHVARFDVLQTVAYVALALILIAFGMGPASLVISMVFANAVAATLGLLLLRRRLHLHPQLRARNPEVTPFIRAAVPIALVGGIAIIYDRLDVLLLSQLGTAVEVARYSVPYTIAKLTWGVPSVIGAAFFPLYARLRDENPPEASRAFFLVVRVFAFLSGATALALTFAGRDVLTFAFGERYAASAPVLTILAWGLVASFQNYVLWYGILAAHKERSVVPIQIAGLAVNVVANILLIPPLGPSGAALAFLLSDLVTTGGQFVLVHRSLYPVPVAVLTVRPIVATLAAVGAGLALATISGILAAAVAALIYVGLLLALQYVTREEWRPLTDPLGALARRLRPGGA